MKNILFIILFYPISSFSQTYISLQVGASLFNHSSSNYELLNTTSNGSIGSTFGIKIFKKFCFFNAGISGDFTSQPTTLNTPSGKYDIMLSKPMYIVSIYANRHLYRNLFAGFSFGFANNKSPELSMFSAKGCMIGTQLGVEKIMNGYVLSLQAEPKLFFMKTTGNFTNINGDTFKPYYTILSFPVTISATIKL